jgi:hypothetical protein
MDYIFPLYLIAPKKQFWQSFREKNSKTFRQTIKISGWITPPPFSYRDGYQKGELLARWIIFFPLYNYLLQKRDFGKVSEEKIQKHFDKQ